MTRTRVTINSVLACCALLGAVGSDAQQRQLGNNRSIVQISDSVYRWGSDGQFGAYIANAAGIVVVDGHYCGSGTVQWLKDELARRHDAPVKYVVLSHDHQSHVCDSELFADTAVTIGHANLRPHVVREQRHSAVPDLTFDDAMDIFLGDLQVRLYYFGPSHSDNLIQVHVPAEGVLVAIDMAKGKSLFPDYRDMDVHSTLASLGELARLENVDVVLPGHGRVTTQQAFRDSRRFIQALQDQILAYQVEGRSLAEIRKLVTMEAFRDYRGLDRFLDTNIVTMYNYLYRYREPNRPISPYEAVRCREDPAQCRTSNESLTD